MQTDAWEFKVAPMVLAAIVVAATVVLVVVGKAPVAWAMALVGLVAQSFLPPAARKLPPSERVTDPELSGKGQAS